MPPKPRQLPVAEIRDLLGVVRALYRHARRARRDSLHLSELESIGRRLQLALELAGTSKEDVAWTNAERACRDLGCVVGALDQALPIVEAAARAVSGTRLVSEREQLRLARKRRND